MNLLELALARNAEIEREVSQPGYLMSHELKRGHQSRRRWRGLRRATPRGHA